MASATSREAAPCAATRSARSAQRAGEHRVAADHVPAQVVLVAAGGAAEPFGQRAAGAELRSCTASGSTRPAVARTASSNSSSSSPNTSEPRHSRIVATVGSMAARHRPRRRALGRDPQRDRGRVHGDAHRRLPPAANQVGQHLLDVALAGAETLDAAVANDARPCRSSWPRPARRSGETSRTFRPARPAGRTRGTRRRAGRGTSSQMPGAVPLGLGMMRLPAGNIACTRFRSGMSRLCRANSPRMYSSDGFVEHQLAAGHLGQHLARQVVGRGSQAAGGHDHVGPVDRGGETPRHWPPGRRPRSCDTAP